MTAEARGLRRRLASHGSLSEMPKITAETATGQQVFEAEAGRKLVLAIEDAGVDILHRCGGNAKCTTCRVEVLGGDPGEMQEAERNRLALETGLAENVRLSCQVRVQDSLSVRVLGQAGVRGLDPGPRPQE
jgi:ferredoxin